MPVEQQPRYSDPQQRRRFVQRLRVLAPLVRARQCDELRSRLADVAGGHAFLLQGGDCAETFAGVRADNIGNKVRVLSSMATVMADAAGVPVVLWDGSQASTPNRARDAPRLGTASSCRATGELSLIHI